jgi:y4mF family transcriptional regulator
MSRRSEREIKESAGPIACYVREKRKKLGYSQEEFATRVGVGLRFIRDMEQGKINLQLGKVNQVLNFLGAQAVPGPLK